MGALGPRQASKFMLHRTGVNRIFCDLCRLTLMRPGWGVETWRDEHKLRTPYGEVQPDSFGRLLHPGDAAEFYFEYDAGTEHRINKRLGARAVATEFNRRGHRTKVGKPWSHTAVLTVLTNRAYVDEIFFRDRHHKAPHSPLVDTDLFDAAQAIVARIQACAVLI
ncbi:MAG: recombinase family protein [bacterium]